MRIKSSEAVGMHLFRNVCRDYGRGTHKLHIQVADVVIEIALDRIDRLKISEGRTQPMGA